MQEEKEYYIWHKVEPKRKYRVWRKDYNGKTFYNIIIEQKNYDNTKSKYYIPITFKKNVSVENETDIIIIKAIENIRQNKNVEDKLKQYSPVFTYMITEFEIVERQEQIEKQAFDEYRENLDENEMITISDDFLD